MKKTSIASFLFLALMKTGSALGLTITPMIVNSGQSLFIECATTESSSCMKMCANPSHCELTEPYCNGCAGTQNLRLKRILDDVGKRIFATPSDFSDESLVDILASAEVISLHPKTIYNYSGVYDGGSIRSQFRALCEGVSDSTGILLLKIDPVTHQPIGIHGAVCNHPVTGESILFQTNHRWQIMRP